MDKLTLRFWPALLGASLALGSLPLSAAEPAAALAAARAASGASDANSLGYLIQSGSEQSSGLTGRWRKSIDLDTGRSRESADFGIFSTAEVWDGRHHWRQDASGGVHPIDSSFMQAVQVTDAWLASLGYLRRGALGAELNSLADQSADGRSYALIRATPRHGQPVDLWFDKESKRLARTVQVMPTSVWTVRYEDYRPVGGLTLAFRIAGDDGDANHPDVIQIGHMDRTAEPIDDFARPRTPHDVTIAGGRSVVPIEFDGDVIVEARLNGRGPFAFILDTGGHDLITPETAQALGLRPVGAGSSGGAGEGTLPEQYTRVDRVDIGGLVMRDQLFSVIPLQFDTVERGARPAIAGILGLELFERLIVRLNYRDRTLAFEPLSDAPFRGTGIRVPIVYTDHEPLLTAKIDGMPGDVGLDTGNSGALVVQGIWADAQGLKDRMRSGFPVPSFGSGGISTNWSSRADFEIAGHQFPRVIAYYAADQKGAFSSRTESGNVGNDILASFALDFDYTHGAIWFQPTPGFVPLPYNRAGVSAYKERADSFKVAAVSPGTPAAEAGLEADDEIIAVDGIAARNLSGWDLRRAVRGTPGTKLTLSTVRGQQSREAVLTLRELLP